MKPALLTTPLNAIGGILCQAQCKERATATWQEEESGFSDQCKWGNREKDCEKRIKLEKS